MPVAHRVRRRFTWPQHMITVHGHIHSLVDHGARRYPVAQVAHAIQRYALMHNRIHLYQRASACLHAAARISRARRGYGPRRTASEGRSAQSHDGPSRRVLPCGPEASPEKRCRKRLRSSCYIAPPSHVVYVIQAERPPEHRQVRAQPRRFDYRLHSVQGVQVAGVVQHDVRPG